MLVTTASLFLDGIKFSKKLEDIEIHEKDDMLFTCEVSDPNIEVKWYKDNILIVSNDHVSISANGKEHSLSIPWACIDDSGTYKAMAGFSKSKAKLTVKGIRI